MHLRNALLTVVASTVLASACATPGPVNQQMPMASRGKIASTEVVVPIKQSEIYIYVPPAGSSASVATSAQFGLLGALVGSLVDVGMATANANAAEKALQPVRDSLVDFNFDETLQAELKTALSQTPWLNAVDARIVKEVTVESLDGIVTASTASGILVISTDYQLNTNADEVIISISPYFYPATADLKALLPTKPTKSGPKTQAANALYRNAFSFRDQVPNAKAGDREANVAAWSAQNGTALRASLRSGATKLAQIMVADLQATPGASADSKTTTGQVFDLDGVAGHVLGSDEGGSLVRLQTGAQVYITKSALEPLQKTSPTAKKSKAEPKGSY